MKGLFRGPFSAFSGIPRMTSRPHPTRSYLKHASIPVLESRRRKNMKRQTSTYKTTPNRYQNRLWWNPQDLGCHMTPGAAHGEVEDCVLGRQMNRLPLGGPHSVPNCPGVMKAKCALCHQEKPADPNGLFGKTPTNIRQLQRCVNQLGMSKAKLTLTPHGTSCIAT